MIITAAWNSVVGTVSKQNATFSHQAAKFNDFGRMEFLVRTRFVEGKVSERLLGGVVSLDLLLFEVTSVDPGDLRCYSLPTPISLRKYPHISLLYITRLFAVVCLTRQAPGHDCRFPKHA